MNTRSSDAREKAGGTGEHTQPKRGLRGSLASAGERVRRAIAGGREKAEDASELPAAVTGTHPVTVAADAEAGRPSVRALARALLHQDRTGAPLEPDQTESLETETESADVDAQADEPKTTPRAKSVPPPLPRQRQDEDEASEQDGDALAARGTSTEALQTFTDVAVTSQPEVGAVGNAARVKAEAAAPAVSSRSAQLRARLAAAKAQLAQTQARLVEVAAPVVESVTTADDAESPEDSLEALESADASAAESSDMATAAQRTAAASDSAETIDDLDEFEDLDATALVEEPAAASDVAT